VVTLPLEDERIGQMVVALQNLDRRLPGAAPIGDQNRDVPSSPAPGYLFQENETVVSAQEREGVRPGPVARGVQQGPAAGGRGVRSAKWRGEAQRDHRARANCAARRRSQ